MKKLINDYFEIVIFIGLVMLVCAIVLWSAKCNSDSDAKKIAGCGNPKFVQVVPHVSGFNGTVTTSMTYIYSCADGSTIEISDPIEYYEVKK